MMYAYLIKSRKNSGKPNLFVWFESKSDSRADREVMNILEDAEIETGRGADHQLPVRTDMPVFDDLPEESELDTTWCDRYELAEDARTWKKIVAAETASADAIAEIPVIADDAIPEKAATEVILSEPSAPSDLTPVDKDLVVDANDDNNTEYPVAEMTFSRRLLSQFTSDATRHHIKHAQRVQIMVMSLDTDNSYVQNLLLAANNAPELQSLSTAQLWKYTDAVKTVFPMDKHHELNLFIQFTKLWVSTEHIDRGILVREWTNGNRITSVQRTDAGTNAGGGIQTDRNPDMVHSLDTLDIEVALALLPFDFNIYDFEQAILRRAKEMVAAKESPWKEWSRKLRNCPGILDYSRAAIFAVIRSAAPNVHMMPGTHQAWINSKLTETNHANPDAETVAIAMRSTALNTTDETSNDAAPEVVKHDMDSTTDNPDVKSLGNGVFSIEGLIGEQSNNSADIKAPLNEAVKKEVNPTETTSNEQMETTVSNEISSSAEIPASESVAADGEEVIAVEQSANEFPAYFEPGRYEGLPNDVYHGANGISSTQVKDARISLMYFHGRHITKTIGRETSDALTFGTLVHALALEPESFDAEFAVFPGVPAGAFTNTESMVNLIKEHNASLPPLLASEDIKAQLEEYNATLQAPLALGGSVDDVGTAYTLLPEEFQTIPQDAKFTATAMKACIKEYNATLPAPLKTSGSREVLLEQLANIKPELVEAELQKPAPFNVSGTKETLSLTVRVINPDAIFAEEFEQQWRDANQEKIILSTQQLAQAKAIQQALFNHPSAGQLLQHPNRANEVSYFGMDEETGLEVRVRPDLEIDMSGVRIGVDLKTISLGKVKQDFLRAKLHREIIERDYHLSAAMYCDVADFNQFFWIFVNKDEGYHWVAIIEASEELLELGRLEYRKAMNAISNALDTNMWPAPITEDYTDELNDFDMRRLEALRLA